MKRWSFGAKIIAGSALGMMLGIGLCGLVPGEVRHSWLLTAGTILSIVAGFGLLAGGVVVAGQRLSKRQRM